MQKCGKTMDVEAPIPVVYIARSKHKDVIDKCAITGKDALYSSPSQPKRFYSSVKLYQDDSRAIQSEIALLLLKATNGSDFVFPEDKRRTLAKERESLWTEILDVCVARAEGWLVEGNYEFALCCAIQAESVMKEHLKTSWQTQVRIFLLSAHVNLGLKRFSVCETALEQARWLIYENESNKETNLMKGKFYKIYGELSVAQRCGEKGKALDQFSKHIYFLARDRGVRHISLARGYFLMAEVFFWKDQIQDGLKFLNIFLEISNAFLASDASMEETLSLFELKEFETSLKKGLSLNQEYRGEQSEETGLNYLALARLSYSKEDIQNARTYGNEALNIFRIVGKSNLKEAKTFFKSLSAEANVEE